MEIRDKAEYEYKKGERAYMDLQGKMFIQDIDMWPVYCNDDASVKEWHALRAYQDEQRKKRVPIVTHFTNLTEQWYHRDCVMDGVKYHYCGGGDPDGLPDTTPEILLIKGLKLGQHPNYHSKHGGFTNFRWREGYPKETQKQTI